MTAPSASTWPTPGDNIDVVTPANVLWRTVKTEEEEYLDKLQSRLSRIMQNGSMAPPAGVENADIDPDDLPDEPSVRPLHDDDPGLHLLYDFPPQKDRSPSPAPSAHSEPAPKPTPRPRLVRFRSRVRITSGVHPSASASSSTCESVSSSISAPLRGLRREVVTNSVLPSGIVSSDAASAWLRAVGPARTSERERRRGAAADERSSLTSWDNSGVRGYTEPNNSDEVDDAEYERMQAAAHKSEEEVMFGRWPSRLINRHWWWWKLEPFLCCYAQFYEDSDEG